MALGNTINSYRRRIMHSLTRDIGATKLPENFNGNISVKHVLICRPNHRLGNLLLITPLLQEVQNIFPDCKIDLFVKGNLAITIFKNYGHVGRIIQLPKKPFSNLLKYALGWLSLRKRRYDLVINVDPKSSSGRLSTKFSNAKLRFYGDESPQQNTSRHIAKYPVETFRQYLSQMGIGLAGNEIPNLDLKLDFQELVNGKRKINALIDPKKKTICLFTYATGNKCHSKSWWKMFYSRIQQEFPNYNIIEVLPVENISQISFRAATFYTKDIRELGAIISNSDVFIGADSGVMHLASAVKTTTIGLFCVTSSLKYAPYNGNSFALNTNHNNMDDCIAALRKVLISTHSGVANPQMPVAS